MNLLPYLIRRYHENKKRLLSGQLTSHTVATQIVEWLFFSQNADQDLIRLAAGYHPVLENEKDWVQELYKDCANRIMQNATLTAKDSQGLH